MCFIWGRVSRFPSAKEPHGASAEGREQRINRRQRRQTALSALKICPEATSPGLGLWDRGNQVVLRSRSQHDQRGPLGSLKPPQKALFSCSTLPF